MEGVKEMDEAVQYCIGSFAFAHSWSFGCFEKKMLKSSGYVGKHVQTELSGLAGREDLSLVWED